MNPCYRQICTSSTCSKRQIRELKTVNNKKKTEHTNPKPKFIAVKNEDKGQDKDYKEP